MANKYFNYENYKELIKILKSNSSTDEKVTMAVKMMEDNMESFNDYVNTVVNGEVKIALAYATLEGQELRDRVMELDYRRRCSHEAAISSVGICNRIASMYGVGNIYEGEITDRYQVADFCQEVVNDLFTNRSK